MSKQHVFHITATTVAVITLVVACSAKEGPRPDAPSAARRFLVRARADLTEGSAAVMVPRYPDVVFTINDSGHEPLLFAIDTLGKDRGAWRIAGASNRDWEAMSPAPCVPHGEPNECLIIGDVGDNDGVRASVRLYRVRTPAPLEANAQGTLAADSVELRFPDRAHDVEGMYAANNGDVFLITKRRLLDAAKKPRPALIYRLTSSVWAPQDTARPRVFVAELVDSLPIVPGEIPGRVVTDAARSRDGTLVAVRTYNDVFIFAADSTTGRLTTLPPSRCDIENLERGFGEGVTWLSARELVLTQEGRNAPLIVVTCKLPSP